MSIASKFHARWVARAFLLGALAGAASTAAAAPSFDLAGSGASVGQSLFVTARAEDLIDLFGYQFTLNFDPSRVQFVGIEEGAFLRSGGATFFDGGVADNVAGTVSFVFDTLIGPVSGVSGSGDLARFQFATLRPGIAAFALSDLLAIDSGLVTIDAQTRSAALGVPEPSTLAAVLLGLLSFYAVRLRASRNGSDRLRRLRAFVLDTRRAA